jgi:hypothetical protein
MRLSCHDNAVFWQQSTWRHMNVTEVITTTFLTYRAWNYSWKSGVDNLNPTEFPCPLFSSDTSRTYNCLSSMSNFMYLIHEWNSESIHYNFFQHIFVLILNEEYYLVGHNSVWSGRSPQQFHLHRAVCFLLISCFAYSFTLKIEKVCCCETSVDFYRSTRHYIAKESTIHNYRRR